MIPRNRLLKVDNHADNQALLWRGGLSDLKLNLNISLNLNPNLNLNLTLNPNFSPNPPRMLNVVRMGDFIGLH